MEHIPGGYYTGSKPCRCDSCRAEHARRAREYYKKNPGRPSTRMKLELAELREFKAQILSLAAQQDTADAAP